MVEILLTAALLAGFVYVLMLATNPRGAWSCPICAFFARRFGGTAPLKSRRAAK